VLAAARLGCNLDYDQPQDLAENHRSLRQIMGIGDWQTEEGEEEDGFDWRRGHQLTGPPGNKPVAAAGRAGSGRQRPQHPATAGQRGLVGTRWPGYSG